MIGTILWLTFWAPQGNNNSMAAMQVEWWHVALFIGFIVVLGLCAGLAIYFASKTVIEEHKIIKEIKNNPQNVQFGLWSAMESEGCQSFSVSFVDDHPLGKNGLIFIENRRWYVEKIMKHKGIEILRR